MSGDGSSNQCSNFYGGPYAFSEPESKLLSNFLMEHRKEIGMFITVKGYGQMISYPSKKLRDVDDIRDVARDGLRNLKLSNISATKFRINANDKLHIHQSGSAVQYAMDKAKIKYSYTIETRDNPTYGFIVPSTSIEENAKDILEIVKGMVNRMKELQNGT